MNQSSAVLSTLTVTTVGLICKALLNSGFCSLKVNGLPTLLRVLDDHRRSINGQGVVTVSNHISTLDDPVTWGVLPTRCYLNSRTIRWSLGASDIMFTNPVFSTFFRLGQTLETFRGKGIYQPAVDSAIKKLNQGQWVHVYGEGKVNQPSTYPKDRNGIPHLPRFKWGVGRILMESALRPTIIPMWLTGFEDLMPEGRSFPYKYLPRPGAQLSVTFGEPLSWEEIDKVLGPIRDQQPGFSSPESIGKMAKPHTDQEKARVRAEISAIIQLAVESLGRSVTGTQNL